MMNLNIASSPSPLVDRRNRFDRRSLSRPEDLDQAEWSDKGSCCVDGADVLNKDIPPSPPSHGPTEAATMVVKVGDGGWLLVASVRRGEEGCTAMDWQMALIR